MKNKISTNQAPEPGGPYSQGIRWGDLLFTAGIGPIDAQTGAVLGERVEEQTRFVLEHVGAILAAGGMGFDDVLKVTVHLANPDRDFDRFNEVYKEFFRDPYPVRTTVGSHLRGILVEIDVVAGAHQR